MKAPFRKSQPVRIVGGSAELVGLVGTVSRLFWIMGKQGRRYYHAEVRLATPAGPPNWQRTHYLCNLTDLTAIGASNDDLR